MSSVALTLVLLLQNSVAGQPSWRVFYDRGEYDKAAVILHSLWMDTMSRDPFSHDLELVDALGRMYASGYGVEQDRLLACSYFAWGSSQARMRFPPHPLASSLERSRDQTCDGTTPEAQWHSMIGCPRFGMETWTFSLSAGRELHVDRFAIEIAHAGHRHQQGLAMSCGSRLALTRHTRIDTDGKANNVARDFFEVFIWRPARRSGYRSLQWQLHELVGESLEVRGAAEVGEESGLPWSNAVIRPDWSEVAFQRKPDGDVQWAFAHLPLSETVPALDIEVAPEAADDPPALSTRGSNSLDVLVVDGFGSIVRNAEVVLNGIVTRRERTDERGLVRFEGLPNGRLDLIASVGGMTSLRPTVVDLPQSEQVVLRLKPFGRAAGSISCGLVDGRSLESLAAAAQFVLHVKVEDQQTTQANPNGSTESERLSLTTASRTRVLNTFKTSGAGARQTAVIHQQGGLIDRGDVIDGHFANGLPPLNVGDEYVVFLGKRDNGDLWLDFPEVGVFLLRNGRVLPHGSSRVAEAWKNRSADRFIEALRARLR